MNAFEPLLRLGLGAGNLCIHHEDTKSGAASTKLDRTRLLGVQGGFFGKARFCWDSRVSSLEHKGTAFDASGAACHPLRTDGRRGWRGLSEHAESCDPACKGSSWCRTESLFKKIPFAPAEKSQRIVAFAQDADPGHAPTVAVTSGATKTPSKDWHAKSTSVTTATPVQFQAKELNETMKKGIRFSETVLLVCLGAASHVQAVTPTAQEKADTLAWVTNAFSASPMFSVVCGGEPSSRFLKRWKMSSVPGKVTFSDPNTGLEMRAEDD